jgi:hypothetical protein
MKDKDDVYPLPLAEILYDVRKTMARDKKIRLTETVKSAG